MTDQNKTIRENIEKLGSVINDIEVAMLTTVDSTTNKINSRPMVTGEEEFDGTLWFFTSVDTPKVDDITNNQRVNVIYSSPNKNMYASVSGRATIERDHSVMAALWNPVYKKWFPDGLEDSSLSLIRVDVEEAEYWDLPAGAATMLVGFAKSLIGENGEKAVSNEKITLEESQ